MRTTTRAVAGARCGTSASAVFAVLGVAGLVMACGAGRALAVPARSVVQAAQADLSAVARRLPVHGSLRVEGVPFEGTTTALELERFEAFAPDAKVVIEGDAGEAVLPAPDNAYFRGAVEGDPSAVAVLTARASGGTRGLVIKDGAAWVIGEDGRSGVPGLKTRKVDMARDFPGRTFRCATEDRLLPPVQAPSRGGAVTPGAAAAAAPTTAQASVNYTARVAVETDYEFFQLFGDTTEATDYVGDLFAYASTIYENEVNTSLVVSYLRLWTTSADPWSAMSCGAALDEFVNYWNANNGGVSRTIAHMLSGRPTGCGIAYIGVLCNTAYGYSVSGSLAGNFDMLNPGVVWDIFVVSHEIGHNFNSPHTHCYNGIGGSDSPVDQCYGSEGGCYSGATSLPCDPNGAGKGCGTIMSYCHLLTGGYGNISLTFGLGFAYGALPGRVPARMHDFVVSTASSDPSCLQYQLPPPTVTPSATPSTAGTGTGPPPATPTSTSSPTWAPTKTGVPTPALTPTATRTRTRTPPLTPTPTKSAAPSATNTPAATPTPTAPAVPAPVSLTASGDAWIDQASPAQNKGTDANLRVLGAAAKLRRSLVQFDLSALPASACVGSATLKLRLTAVQRVARTFAVYPLTQGWTERRVTWNRRDALSAWTVAGGDAAAVPSAAVPTGTRNGVTLTWDVTADVAAFLAGTATNYGWLVKDADEGTGGEFRFASRENGTVANRPQLAITFVPCP